MEMSEEQRRVYFELAQAVLKVICEMSGGTYATMFGDGKDQTKLAVYKGSGESIEKLVDYDCFMGKIRDGVKDNA
jgi:hypothetical protein